MILLKKQRVGLILAGVLAVTMPMDVFASGTDIAKESASGQISEDSVRKESEGLLTQEEAKQSENTKKEADVSDVQKKDAESPEGETEEKISLEQCTVTLSETSYVCDGKEKKPIVTVMYDETLLKENNDYSVKYENHVWPGTAKVMIEGMGNYEGTRTEEYMICLGSTKITSTSSYTAVKLMWESVSGANGYQISRSTSQNGTYTAIANISSGSSLVFNDANTKFNGTYYYKIRASRSENGSVTYGDWSQIKAQKKMLAAPTITSAKTSKTSIKLTWKKVKGATGYVVYRSKSENGKYKKIATLKKASDVTYTDKNAAKKGYCYKVKAYRTVNKKKCYGYASEAKVTAKAKSTASSENNGAGWRYVNGYKLYYDKNGKLVKDVSSIIGKQSSYVIKVNKKKNCVTVYAKDGKNGYIIPVKAFPCSAGNATPITTARTPAKYRWHRLNGNCYGQWCTRIKQGFLFHSVMYGKTTNTSLSVSNYNKLGTTASHGCIRLRAGDAKWIYDNCKLKTKVIIYNSSNPGPLGKPSAVKLPKWHKWDPTDPTARAKCKQRGCH